MGNMLTRSKIDSEGHRCVNHLPTEILELLLEQLLRNTCSRKRDISFSNALAVCPEWRTIGERLPWTEVSLSNNSIAPFNSSTSRAVSLTRTLSLTINALDYTDDNVYYNHHQRLDKACGYPFISKDIRRL
jgi:hypothetical protein